MVCATIVGDLVTKCGINESMLRNRAFNSCGKDYR